MILVGCGVSCPKNWPGWSPSLGATSAALSSPISEWEQNTKCSLRGWKGQGAAPELGINPLAPGNSCCSQGGLQGAGIRHSPEFLQEGSAQPQAEIWAFNSIFAVPQLRLVSLKRVCSYRLQQQSFPAGPVSTFTALKNFRNNIQTYSFPSMFQCGWAAVALNHKITEYPEFGGSTRIKSSSWPCTGQPKNPKLTAGSQFDQGFEGGFTSPTSLCPSELQCRPTALVKPSLEQLRNPGAVWHSGLCFLGHGMWIFQWLLCSHLEEL